MSKTKKITFNAVLIALIVLFGLTPVGYIKIPPIEMTLIAIPVIVATLSLGLSSGLICGLAFALTSLAQVFISPTALSALFYVNPVKMLLIIFIPRLLVPVTTYFAAKLFKRQYLSNTVAAVVGSITNTVFFLAMLYFLFTPDVASILGLDVSAVAGVLAGVGLLNGGVEAVVCAIVCPPIVLAIQKAFRR